VSIAAILSDRNAILSDKSLIPSDKDAILSDKSLIPSDRNAILSDKNAIPSDKSAIPYRHRLKSRTSSLLDRLICRERYSRR
jgi:hypothetical protein